MDCPDFGRDLLIALARLTKAPSGPGAGLSQAEWVGSNGLVVTDSGQSVSFVEAICQMIGLF